MKTIILFFSALIIFSSCKQNTETNPAVRNGFYQVMKLGTKNISDDSLLQGQVVIGFDTLFNSGDYTKVVIDTTDYVPLELDGEPTTEQQTLDKKLLSVTLSSNAAAKLKDFTSKRIMKQVVIVLDGKGITMHKIRETLTGPGIQITRCGDNACEYLYLKMSKK